MHALIASLFAFGFGFIGSVPLTGPISVIVVAKSAESHHDQALRIGLGAALAEGIYAAIAFWGFTTFLSRHPWVLPISHAVSAVVLTLVGLHFIRWRAKDQGNQRGAHRPGSFWVGFSISAMNPTLLATWTAGVAFLYSRQLLTFAPPLILPFGAAAALGVGTWESLMVLALKTFADRFPKKALTWIVRAMGVVLIGVAAFAAVDLLKVLSHR